MRPSSSCSCSCRCSLCPGIEGRLFAPLGIAYIVSILGSLVVSITVTPVLSYYLLTAPRPHERDQFSPAPPQARQPGAAALGDGESPAASLRARRSRSPLAAYAATLLPRTFLPPFNEGTLTISLQYNPGISLRESNRLGLVAERLLMGVPEVASVGRRTGRAELDEHAEGVHFSEIDVDLKRSSARRRRDRRRHPSRALPVLPASLNVGQPISHRLDHMLSGIRAEIALKIYGDDLDTLRSLAETVARPARRRVRGLADLQVEKQNRIPQLRVEADHERAALYGITPAALTQALEGMSNGRTVSQVVTEGNRRFDVVIRLSDSGPLDRRAGRSSHRHALRSRSAAHGRPDRGDRRPQSDLPRERPAPHRRLCQQRRQPRPHADRRGHPPASWPRRRWPQGYTTRLEGSYQAQEEATLRIGLLSLVSLALIFIVLQSRYRSPVLALIIMGSVPLALIGSVMALWIAGQPLSVASMIGFVTLAGISTRNGILKISRYINLALHEGESFGRDSSFAAASIGSRRCC